MFDHLLTISSLSNTILLITGIRVEISYCKPLQLWTIDIRVIDIVTLGTRKFNIFVNYNNMSISNIVGLSFIISGSALQEFAIYRRSQSQTHKKCNDSKATLLLYYSTGMSCEITGFFLVSLYSYLAAGTPYTASFHMLSQAYFTYKIPPTRTYKISCGLFLMHFL